MDIREAPAFGAVALLTSRDNPAGADRGHAAPADRRTLAPAVVVLVLFVVAAVLVAAVRQWLLDRVPGTGIDIGAAFGGP